MFKHISQYIGHHANLMDRRAEAFSFKGTKTAFAKMVICKNNLLALASLTNSGKNVRRNICGKMKPEFF
jgi:hypothetical protein